MSSITSEAWPHPFSQRQLKQIPTVDVRQKLIDCFAALRKRAQEKGPVEIQQSRFERQREAMLFVSKDRQWHAMAEGIDGELTHIHAGFDGSIHVVLHLLDCKAVIEVHWDQRHAFLGVPVLKKLIDFSLPANYV